MYIFTFATHGFLLDSYRVRLLVVLPFNPALACWLLPNELGVMLSPLHLRDRFCTYLCSQLSLTA
jgi:hypothetical protein